MKTISREREREREQKLIITEIKTELNHSPVVNITELESKYHNYENWKVNELVNEKDNVLKAIQSKRTEKKFLELLSQAKNCSENNLWSFIQNLEKLLSPSASPAEKAFYSAHQNQVDRILNQLKQRWNNLSEEQKLTGYWNKAITDFENLLKEAEDLRLTSDDEFFNFPEKIKNYRTQTEITEQEKKAKAHILAKFKVAVKEKLGIEQQTNEYQEIDNAETFEAVKAAKNNINQRRQNPVSPPPSDKKDEDKDKKPDDAPNDKDKNDGKDKQEKEQKTSTNSDLTAKIVITGITVLIVGGIIAVAIKIVRRKWKKLKKRKSVK